jgi:hypothetical protein
MIMKRLIVLAVFALFVVGAVLAVRWLPWWALVLGFLLLVALGKWAIGRIVRKLMLMPFGAKGAVLKGASARVHGVSPAGASGESRKHYLVEVTITPSDPKDHSACENRANCALCGQSLCCDRIRANPTTKTMNAQSQESKLKMKGSGRMTRE